MSRRDANSRRDSGGGEPSAVVELHVELLVGCTVVDVAGQRVGRIEELIAEQSGSEWIITEVHVGSAGLAERFSVSGIGIDLTRFLGARAYSRKPWRINWQDLDFSDPEHPRLRKRVEELQPGPSL